MKKNIFITAALALASLSASAQSETMYLVKGDRVVGKYNVEDVDYATFTLPQDVTDSNIWLNVDKTGKNTVTYTINTVNDYTAYAHNIISYYEANYVAMDMFGDMIENLDDESREYCLKLSLSTNAFVSAGTRTFTQTDYQEDGTGMRFNVTPGTKYYLCAWEIDASSQEPLDLFVYDTLETQAPAQSQATLDVSFKRFNEEGTAFNITGSDDILYVVTTWGYKEGMELYRQAYGLDFLLGTFGQRFSLETLQGDGELRPGVENATWPVNDSGEYILYIRAYDKNGDSLDREITVKYEGTAAEGPQIKIWDKEKSIGRVKLNFEITPSNVEEAYVRMLDENTVDDRINDGYKYYEIASGGDAIDITREINTLGEYTFEQTGVPNTWQAILIYAKDKMVIAPQCVSTSIPIPMPSGLSMIRSSRHLPANFPSSRPSAHAATPPYPATEIT